MTKPILIVDDYDDILYLIELVLKSDGYEVISAANGREALKLAQRVRPQLMLMDIMMPDVNGLEISQQIRQNKELSSTQILLVSANHEISAEQAKENGADGILHKPFNIDYLLSQVHKLLDRKSCSDRECLPQFA
ncbi:response regulator [Myxosarcina sp. GI1]|uniref:response regulator n=1 Tax=Myxosarcina sp. GI1 TaxID=1541065 RepID=UPI00056D4A19|nr:response regulator [Myxosarcina sp. GI1]